MTIHEFPWPTTPLWQVCDVVIGKTPSRSEPRYWGPGHPWLSIRDMSGAKYLSTTSETITDAAIKECGCKPIKKDTVLMSFKLSIGKLAFAGTTMFTNEAIVALPILNKQRLDREFLYYALSVSDLMGEVDKAAKGLTLNKDKINRIEIPLPPIDVQKQIVEVLNLAEAARIKQRLALTRLDQLFDSIAARAFGGDLPLPQSEPAV